MDEHSSGGGAGVVVVGVVEGVGISATTAERHSAHAGADYARYAALRT